jgi:para-aminobenzoate synthetase / 4-amino-4-deoxychorismate lyase
VTAFTSQPVRNALDFGERPDPAFGIFETILFSDGAAPLLDEQLERLAASARELYGVALSTPASGIAPDLPSGIAAALPSGTGRLRVTFVPGSAPTIDHGPRGSDPSYSEVAPFVLPGGLGRHKWLDRRLLDAITIAAGATALPLLVDGDGSVLESARMNVLIEERGRLISPPSDGRFRAGFGRRRLQYDEEPVDLDRLLAADAVVLTSALRVVRVPR